MTARRIGTAPLVGIAALVAAICFALQAKARLDWADEGFYWYGVIQASKGQMPVRDFQAYEVGRYFLGALLAQVFGSGIIVARLASSLFQGFCLFAGLVAARRILNHGLWLFGVAGMASAWMVAQFRYFDAGIPLLMVCLGVWFFEKPSPKRRRVAGAVCGALFLMGTNHGVYATLIVFLSVIYVQWKGGIRCSLKEWAPVVLGMCIGGLPLMALWMWVPGFASASLERFSAYSTQLGASYSSQGFWEALRARPFLENLAFLTWGLFCLGSVLGLMRLKAGDLQGRELWAASAVTAAVYGHHVFSRMDVIHLGEAFFPVLMGLLALPQAMRWKASRAIQAMVSLWLLILTIFIAVPAGNLAYQWPGFQKNAVLVKIGKEALWLPKSDAVLLDQLRSLIGARLEPGEPLLIAPLLTTLYCVLERESPVWEIYFYRPVGELRERRMLDQLEEKKVNWALIGTNPLDQSGRFQLDRTHPLLSDYLDTQFISEPVGGLPPGYRLLRRNRPS